MFDIIPIFKKGSMSNAIKFGIVATVFVLIWLTYTNRVTNLDLRPKIIDISINGAPINVEIVRTEFEMAKGLSGRESLNEGKGMWFVFPVDGNYGFWMKDMKFPIDIIWFGRDLKIVALEKNVLPESYPEIFYPNKNSRYVLEVTAGFSEKSKIKIGDMAEVISK